MRDKKATESQRKQQGDIRLMRIEKYLFHLEITSAAKFFWSNVKILLEKRMYRAVFTSVTVLNRAGFLGRELINCKVKLQFIIIFHYISC